MALHERILLSITVRPWVKVIAVLDLIVLAAGAAAGMLLVAPPLGYLFLLVIPVIGIGALRLIRHRWWMEGTIIFKQRALRVTRIDLSHANVTAGYLASGSRLTTIKAHDPIHGVKLTIPLLTAAGKTLPPEEIKSLHDAIMAGQRWRQNKTSDRAAAVGSHLQKLA